MDPFTWSFREDGEPRPALPLVTLRAEGDAWRVTFTQSPDLVAVGERLTCEPERADGAGRLWRLHGRFYPTLDVDYLGVPPVLSCLALDVTPARLVGELRVLRVYGGQSRGVLRVTSGPP